MTDLHALWFCNDCGARKPDPEPGLACPDGCGSRVTSSRPPATVRAALAILRANDWQLSVGAVMDATKGPPINVHFTPHGGPMSPSLEELTAAGYVSGWTTTVTSPQTKDQPEW